MQQHLWSVYAARAAHLQLGALASDELRDGAAEVRPSFLLQHACTGYSTLKAMIHLCQISACT